MSIKIAYRKLWMFQQQETLRQLKSVNAPKILKSTKQNSFPLSNNSYFNVA